MRAYPRFVGPALLVLCSVWAGCGINRLDIGRDDVDAAPGFGFGDLSAAIDDAGPQILSITPPDSTLQVVSSQPLPTTQFKALLNDNPTGVAWAVDRGEIGSIDQNGLFTPTGGVGGVANVIAVYGALKASTTITVNILNQQIGDPAYVVNPPAPGAGGYGGVGGDGAGAPASMVQQAALSGAPTQDATVKLLYPYDGTVWPRGLLPPLLQWSPSAHTFDSVYVHIQEKNFEYKGYFAANVANFVNLPIPTQAWSQLTYSNSGEPVTVTLIFAQGGSAFGPYVETWTIAQATLKGTIYYNSYGTYLVQNSNDQDHNHMPYGAGTLAIQPGATSPVLVAGLTNTNGTYSGNGCRVCHTVSADGKSLVTQNGANYSQTLYLNLANDATGGAGTALATQNLAFPALYKDGSLLLSSSGGMIDGDSASRLYSVPAGTLLPNVVGLPQGFQGALPAFSPDGAHVAFNLWGGTLSNGSAGDQRSLAMMDFDGVNTFSNPSLLYTPPGNLPVTFSSFLPSSTGIVFETELSNPAGAWGYTWNGNTGEIWWVDVATKKAARLDQLNGIANGASYLPDNGANGTHPPGLDPTLNYEPTVNPIASGGYAWVVFTSRRMYGNVAALGPWVSDPRNYDATTGITDKKLWVSAMDLNGAPGTDPSHPAFYLPAQEIHAGNARGFWTVEKCHPDGNTCDTGDECCGGYCEPTDGGLACTSVMPVCAAEYEKCNKDSDCCGAAEGISCINHICTLVQPPIQ